MARQLFSLIVVLAMTTATAAAQDARAVLQAAAKNMGADTLRTIEISGTGMNAAVGQSFAPGTDWPRFEVTSYTKTIDYENRASSEQITRRQGNYPPQGGGGTPLQGEQQQHFVVSGNSAWNMQGTTANPAEGAAEIRQLDIWLTPHGFLEGGPCAGANPTAYTRTSQLPADRWPRVTVVSFTALGKYQVSGAITIRIWSNTSRPGSTTPFSATCCTRCATRNTATSAGVKFPADIHVHQGDQRLDEGHNSFQFRVKNVRANLTVAPIAVPDNVRKAPAPPTRRNRRSWQKGCGTRRRRAQTA